MPACQVVPPGPGGAVVVAVGCGPGVPEVSSARPYAARIGLTGWKYMTPPEVQLPEPPEVTPCAWLPASQEPPESPGSAQAFVRVSPETVPSAYVTEAFFCWMVPQCQPVVEPERQTAAPTVASVEPATATVPPL